MAALILLLVSLCDILLGQDSCQSHLQDCRIHHLTGPVLTQLFQIVLLKDPFRIQLRVQLRVLLKQSLSQRHLLLSLHILTV